MTDRPPRCIADRGTAEAAAQQQRHRSSSTGAAAQQQQHSSSDGSDVAATDEKDERGYTGDPFVFVLALSRIFFNKKLKDVSCEYDRVNG